MFKVQRPTLSIALMMSSIALLLLLQSLWLVNSYDQAYNDLRRRTSDLFRGTLVAMRDSLFQKSFEKFSPVPDSIRVGAGRAMFFSFNVDTLPVMRRDDRGLHSRA